MTRAEIERLTPAEEPAPMTPEDFAAAMRSLQSPLARKHGDGWDGDEHELADDLMCRLLRTLGYGEGVDVFEATGKWWA